MPVYKTVLEISFTADDDAAAAAMSALVLQTWNVQVQPDVPSNLKQVEDSLGVPIDATLVDAAVEELAAVEPEVL